MVDVDDRSGPIVGALLEGLPRRWRVFIAGLLVSVLIAAAVCLLVVLKTGFIGVELASLLLRILAGPFAARWEFPEQGGWLIPGLANLAFLFAHPVRPTRFTAVATGLAFASWIFWGLAISLSSI